MPLSEVFISDAERHMKQEDEDHMLLGTEDIRLYTANSEKVVLQKP